MKTAIKERPILFSAPMVRAILEGRKTQTRRLLKPQPVPCNGDTNEWNHLNWPIDCEWRHEPTKFTCPMNDGFWACGFCGNGVYPPSYQGYKCPFGKPGDRLWLRETWLQAPGGEYDQNGEWCPRKPSQFRKTYYAADGIEAGWEDSQQSAWRYKIPSIHMPRWACRITLEITNVRVERLQEISEEDAQMEGVKSDIPKLVHGHISGFSARENFRELWNSIYKTWDANPWVWVIEFKRVE